MSVFVFLVKELIVFTRRIYKMCIYQMLWWMKKYFSRKKTFG